MKFQPESNALPICCSMVGYLTDNKGNYLMDDEGGRLKVRVIKALVTTIGMASQRKKIKDRVVMRHWMWFAWEKSPKWKVRPSQYNVLKIGTVLLSRTVRDKKNRNLDDNLIKKHGLTEEHVDRYQKIFDQTKSNLNELESLYLDQVIDIKNRVDVFLQRRYELGHEELVRLGRSDCLLDMSCDETSESRMFRELLNSIDVLAKSIKQDLSI